MSASPIQSELGGRRWFWLLLCFSCSGISALIYEVAWVRSLELVFGATTFAVATVLAAFMGGLAFGSYGMGRLSPRLARFHPLKIYALMELGIGLIALGIPYLFHFLAPLYQAIWQHYHASFAVFSTLRFLLCVAILIIPTSLMGATLPIMSGFVNRTAQSERGQRRIGLLYTVNTAGAVLGCLAAGFLLFPLVGLHLTQLVAVALSSTAALGAFLLSRMHQWEPAPAAEPEAAPAAAAPEADRRTAWLVVLLYAVSGFTAMLYEVAWSRLLVQVLGSSTYAYSMMLGTFLFGLALGAGLATRYLVRSAQPLWTLGLCQLVVGVTTYGGALLIDQLPFCYARLYYYFQPQVPGTMAMLFLLSFGLMILPTIALGAMFPVAIRALNPSGAKTARVVGWAYSLNTLGAIVGSVAAGFWLLPLLGSQITLLIGIALNAVMAGLAFAAARTGRLARYRYWLAGLACVFALNSLVRTPEWGAHLLASGMFRYARIYQLLDHQRFEEAARKNHGEIQFFKEGLTCNVIVFRTPSALSLLVNGKPDASTPSSLAPVDFAQLPVSQGDLPTQVLLGQVPLLLASQADRVAVIGLGSGVTLGSVLRHPVKEVECIELENAVVQASHLFDDFNGRPLEDSRVRIVVNDARNHLLVTDKQYDVIISEPSNPWIPGASTLFTREFFELAKSRLRPGGIFCQWVQMYELHITDFQTILRSLGGTFPNLHLFRVGNDAIILATPDPLPLDFQRIQDRITPAIQSDLARIHLANAPEFLAQYFIGGRELTRALPPGPINTDDNMYIEFRAPLRVLVREAQNDLELTTTFKNHATGLLPWLQPPAQEEAAVFWGRMAAAAVRAGRPDEAMLYARNSLRLSPNAMATVAYGQALTLAKQPAADWWKQAAKDQPEAPEIFRAQARYFIQETNYPAAFPPAQRYGALMPDDLEGRYLAGKCFYHLGDWPQAEAALGPLLTAFAAHTNWADLPKMAGVILGRLGRAADALPALQLALEKDYWDMEARQWRAEMLQRLNRMPEALLEWQRLGQLRSSKAQNRLGDARAARKAGQAELARKHLEEAYGLDPWDESIIIDLSQMRARQGNVKAAIQLIEDYLRWNHDRPWAVGYLGQLHAKAGDEKQARALFSRFHALTGQPWTDMEE
jgi:spermidine synthase